MVAFIKATLLHDSRIVGRNAEVRAVVLLAPDRYGKQTALAEKPKNGELQMDWLRSEDLKEVKVVTAPLVSLAAIESVV